MARGRWLTPDEPGDVYVSRCISVPLNLLPALNGALDTLGQSYNWEAQGTMTPDEAADAYRVVLDAYYESECGVAQIFPISAFMFWNQGVITQGNALLYTVEARQAFLQYWNQNAPAINDTIVFDAVLQAGTYDLTMMGTKSNTQGIATWSVDDIEDAQTMDCYNASFLYSQQTTISVVVPTDGLHYFKCKMKAKHASSSNYNNIATFLMLRRTGA